MRVPGLNTIKAKEAIVWTQAHQHHHVELAEGKMNYKRDWTAWLEIYDMNYPHINIWVQMYIYLVKRWMAPWFGDHHKLMTPSMSYIIWCWYACKTCEPLTAPPPPTINLSGQPRSGCQDLHPIIAPNPEDLRCLCNVATCLLWITCIYKNRLI